MNLTKEKSRKGNEFPNYMCFMFKTSSTSKILFCHVASEPISFMKEWLLETRNCLNVLQKDSYPEKGVLRKEIIFLHQQPSLHLSKNENLFLKRIDCASLQSTFLNLHGATIHDACTSKVRMQCSKIGNQNYLFEGPHLPPHSPWSSLLMHTMWTCPLHITIPPKKWVFENKKLGEDIMK